MPPCSVAQRRILAAGAAYLIYLGIQAIRHRADARSALLAGRQGGAGHQVGLGPAAGQARGRLGAYRRGRGLGRGTPAGVGGRGPVDLVFVFRVADEGFNPYAAVVVTRREFLKGSPEHVRNDPKYRASSLDTLGVAYLQQGWLDEAVRHGVDFVRLPNSEVGLYWPFVKP